jgi:hypothetical protein
MINAIRLGVLILVTGLSAGCDSAAERVASVSDPQLAQLAALQKAHRDGDTRAIAAHRPSCSMGAVGCDRVYEMVGDACLRLAQQNAGLPDAQVNAACAADRYGTLRDAAVQRAVLRELEAHRQLRESASGQAARRANDQLSALAAGAGNPSAGFWRADAVEWQDAFVRPANCPDLRRAAVWSGEAAMAPAREGLEIQRAAEGLSTRLTQQADSRGCAP